MMADNRICIVVPVFDHENGLRRTIAALEAYDLKCLLVDDGSGAPCRAAIDDVAAVNPWVSVLRRRTNGGKGAAVKDGLRWTLEHGFTHALQIDADLQHDPRDIPKFLAIAAQYPDSYVIGKPIFDASMPTVRRFARHLTHFWVRINTLSLAIEDSMCGFRIYPLTQAVALLDEEHIGDRMDFDIEVLVKAHWRGGRFKNVSTRVRYPIDGVSHFHLLKDNILIAGMHARCFFSMLMRLPRRGRRR